MRKLLLPLPCLILMCGFGPAPFDASAVPKASVTRKQALEACGARTDFKSSAEVIDCVVAADSNFAHAIRLTDLSLLQEYMIGVKNLDAGIIAGSIKPDDIAKNFRAIQDKFFKGINEQYTDYQGSVAEDLNTAASQAHATTGMNNGMGMMSNMGGMNGTGNNGMNGMGN